MGERNLETEHPSVKIQKKDRDDSSLSGRNARAQNNDILDIKFGYHRYTTSADKIGWLINIHPADILDENKRLVSAVDFYFIEEDGKRFKATKIFEPYFYVGVKKSTEREVTSYLSRKFSGRLSGIDIVDKEDLDLVNHLVGLKRRYLKLRFSSVEDLIKGKREIMPAVRKNRERDKVCTTYDPSLFTNTNGGGDASSAKTTDQMENITDIREHDVPYHIRVAIDLKINVGHWYVVHGHGTESPDISVLEEQPDRPEPIVMAYDIETTKLPLKFPDSSSDSIMMISYMIDGQGYLITNREVVGEDVQDFEYTPKPDCEGPFTIFNEPDEAHLLRKFIDHIIEVKPNIFVTYNGDFFDWPYVDARASFHGINMEEEIGFAPDNQNEYKCRPCIHMDAYRWVRRDSYLPVGSQNLKATTRAKLRYDPVELDPEDMCRMASEDPQGMANYSVSDAVATYYLYMKYIHPFIFALCTIVPMEPDEVLRKGTGTLCEALLMVQAFHGNIVFPNKQEVALNKLTSDGHLLDTETYVGGHVESLESGVFRSDIACHFKMDTEMCQILADDVRRTMVYTIEKEEKIPSEQVTNLDQVCEDITKRLLAMKATPLLLENPMIYHLDVSSMYPNIILTNRLQPSSIVDEATCAACDFNRPGATCQRDMKWMWRGDYMPASRNEYQSIRLQLESETFLPDRWSSKPRSFHSLPPQEQAQHEKKRLQEYCRKAYRKIRMTRQEERTSVVCQRENSFYVDTVRAFRDRRYQFKDLDKIWRKKWEAAKSGGDPAEIKSCKNKEILYNSLQLAHKCILNSFYGYVMRKGARWYSMEMAGLVCYTGANIITKAREIVERIGRPLELDTDGIWCILPGTFPENYELTTTHPKRAKVTVSYLGAMLNIMVSDHFTNNQYQELVDPDGLEYKEKSENSIFFEGDGPYRAMILPASKEEGKRLKKRYAVFNMDGTLAELKGFEVKRRGELQLVKNFQSSVFEVFLDGTTLEECYESVARIANYWLDVLYSQAEDMPDTELFDLVSENRSMSRKLEDYGEQKSTSISTAKRLAEFLGDQMVKDAGLACRFIISRKPEGSPVTERAIPLAIFQSEPSVKKHYLRKWLKTSGLENFDIRAILDWNYYIERLGSAIQKIITIPAAMQGVPNPVPRVSHPDWLRKRMLEKNDICKQQKITEIFKKAPNQPVEENGDISVSPSSSGKRSHGDIDPPDIEDIGQKKLHLTQTPPTVTKHRQPLSPQQQNGPWRTVLGPPPERGTTKEEFVTWLKYHKEKWKIQKKRRQERKQMLTQENRLGGDLEDYRGGRGSTGGLTGYLRQQNRALVDLPWQIIQVAPSSPGYFTLWVLVGGALHRLNLSVPRVFYVNSHSSKELQGEGTAWRRVSKVLPRSAPVLHLSEYSVAEEIFQEHAGELATQLSSPDIEGVYETQVPPLFRVVVSLGCMCSLNRKYSKMVEKESFELDHLDFKTTSDSPYLEMEDSFKQIFIFHSMKDSRSMFGVFFLSTHKASIFVVDRVRTNQMPNLSSLYQTERTSRLARFQDYPVPPAEYTFEARVETELRRVHRHIHRLLVEYKDARRGPTVILFQSPLYPPSLASHVPSLEDFPIVQIPPLQSDSQYPVLDWQRGAAKKMIQQFLNTPAWIQNQLEHARYAHVPLGNLPPDPSPYISDVIYARYLLRHNHILWASPMDQPDLGGREDDDHRLITDAMEGRSVEMNNPGAYPTCCVELSLDGLAVNTILQSHHINDHEGASGSSISFDWAPQASLEELIEGTSSSLTVYDEAALCSSCFKILRGMVNSWLSNVTHHQSYHADLQLQHFYRWIRSPTSMLYEPALCRMIHKLMKKMFMQLIGEFRRLGASIVYADFSKILICTKKRRMEDASAYIKFILGSIKSRELFHSLQMEPTMCWEYLLWMDQANYGGIRVDLPKSLQNIFNEGEEEDKEEESQVEEGVESQIEEGEELPSQDAGEDSEPMEGGGGGTMEASGSLDETWGDMSIHTTRGEEEEGEGEGRSSMELQMNWNICTYLPEAGSCQNAFQVIIGGHIRALYNHALAERLGHTPGATPIRKRTVNSQTQFTPDPTVTASSVTFAQERITKEIAEKLFGITQKIHHTLGSSDGEKEDSSSASASASSNVFPCLPGSHLVLTNPALEFVKAVCKVLSLDSSTRHQVTKLRRDLLKLIGVREFSLEAIFQDLCQSFILPEVICEFCNNCRDLDLCRDTFSSLQDSTQRIQWCCSHCKNPYNRDVIEQSLIESVNRKSMAFILQDLVCSKCHGVKESNMGEYCTCAGHFTESLSHSALVDQLVTFRNIARHYGLELLLENVTWQLELNNAHQ